MAYELTVVSKSGHVYVPTIFDDFSEAVESFLANERLGMTCTLKHLVTDRGHES